MWSQRSIASWSLSMGWLALRLVRVIRLSAASSWPLCHCFTSLLCRNMPDSSSQSRQVSSSTPDNLLSNIDQTVKIFQKQCMSHRVEGIEHSASWGMLKFSSKYCQCVDLLHYTEFLVSSITLFIYLFFSCASYYYTQLLKKTKNVQELPQGFWKVMNKKSNESNEQEYILRTH